MSTFSSLCHENHDDPIDVAYCFVEDWVRLWVKCDEDNQKTTTYLTVEQAEHVIKLMQLAIERINKTYGK